MVIEQYYLNASTLSLTNGNQTILVNQANGVSDASLVNQLCGSFDAFLWKMSLLILLCFALDFLCSFLLKKYPQSAFFAWCVRAFEFLFLLFSLMLAGVLLFIKLTG